MGHDALDYISNPDARIVGPRGFQLETPGIVRAIHRTRTLIDKLRKFEIDVFALLGMRNLSAFIGEVFAAAMIIEHDPHFRKNPHQDGYPDLLLLDDVGQREWRRLEGRLREKAPFSPFRPGGFEVKATCGSVPTPAQCRARGKEKPDIGDQRVELLAGYDWKAHHQETNNLFGLVWDFIDGCPTIVAVFYRGDLRATDWGGIIQPRAGGGRTTSVSIMTRDGVGKMYGGWISFLADDRYAEFFDRRNGGTRMREALAAHRRRRPETA